MNRRDARVLLVEPDEAMRHLFHVVLERSGLGAVEEAPDADTALHWLRLGEPFHLVISEWHMPKVTGLELLRRIRASPDLQQVPVLIASTYTSLDDVTAATNAGVSGFVNTPYFSTSLEEKLCIYIGPGASDASVASPEREAGEVRQ